MLFPGHHELIRLRGLQESQPYLNTGFVWGKCSTLRCIQQRDLCNSHSINVRWGRLYFCSSSFALFFCSKKACQSQQRVWDLGTWPRGWGKMLTWEFQTPPLTLQTPVSCQTPSPSFLGMNPRSQYLSPQCQYLSPQCSGAQLLSAEWTAVHFSSPLHSCFTHLHIYIETKWLQTKQDNASGVS